MVAECGCSDSIPLPAAIVRAPISAIRPPCSSSRRRIRRATAAWTSLEEGQSTSGMPYRLYRRLLVEDIDVDIEQSRTGGIELLEGAPAQVDNATGDVWPAIGDLSDDRATGVGVFDDVTNSGPLIDAYVGLMHGDNFTGRHRVADFTLYTHIDSERGLCAVRLAGWSPWDLLDHEAEEMARDRAEGVRVAYVAATRARDLLVVPALGDEMWDGGWFGPLNRALYPPVDRRRAATRAPKCPPFKSKDSVLERPNDETASAATVCPGQHAFESGSDCCSVWEPRG